MAEIDKTQVGLFVEKDSAEKALSGFRAKVEDVAKAIEKGASVTEAAESKKATAINETTAAVNKQIEAYRRLNGLSAGSFQVVKYQNAESLEKTLEDEADK